VAVTLTPTDPGKTGIAGYFLSEGTTAPTVGQTGWLGTAPTTTFTFTGGQGVKALHAWVKDSNNSVSAMATDSSLFDSVAPTATITAPATQANNPLTVTVGGADSGSGIVGYAVVLGTTPPVPNDAGWSQSRSLQIRLAPGENIVSAFTRDAAGNVSAAATATVTYTGS
jgi:hypothetical protein